MASIVTLGAAYLVEVRICLPCMRTTIITVARGHLFARNQVTNSSLSHAYAPSVHLIVLSTSPLRARNVDDLIPPFIKLHTMTSIPVRIKERPLRLQQLRHMTLIMIVL